MKSLIEEATSVEKAIEKAWTRAGKPHTFSVKIFEEPQTNFFGLLTKKSAKVGIFFDERHVQQVADEKGEKSQSVNTNLSRRPAGRQDDRQQRAPRNNNRNQHQRRDRDQESQERTERQPEHRSNERQERPERTHRPERRSEQAEQRPERRPYTPRPNAHAQSHHEEKVTHNAPEVVAVERQEPRENREPREVREPREHKERSNDRGDREQRFDRNRRPNTRRPHTPREDRPERSTSESHHEAPAAPQITGPVFEFTAPSATTGVKKPVKASSRRYIARKDDVKDSGSNNDSSENQ